MKKQFVKDLIIGNKVNDVFYLRERKQLSRRDGGKFLILELADRTGSIQGKLWDNISEFYNESIPGNFVKVQGDISEYNGETQITISNIQKISDKEISAQDFIAASKYDIEAMYRELTDFIAQVKDKDYKKLLVNLFSDCQFVEQFKNAPASTGIHHGYLGGLLEHTIFMLRLSRTVPETYPEIDYSLLLTGLILHDIGKITSYTYQKAIDHTDEGNLIGHIVRGYEIAKNEIEKIPDFPEEKKQLILHIILSHHGLREYGSPVTPKFPEAFMVHDLDNLDARMMMFRDMQEKNPGVKWTEYHQFLETRIFIKNREKV